MKISSSNPYGRVYINIDFFIIFFFLVRLVYVMLCHIILAWIGIRLGLVRLIINIIIITIIIQIAGRRLNTPIAGLFIAVFFGLVDYGVRICFGLYVPGR